MNKFTNTRATLDSWIRAAIDLGLDFEVQHERGAVMTIGWRFTTSSDGDE